MNQLLIEKKIFDDDLKSFFAQLLNVKVDDVFVVDDVSSVRGSGINLVQTKVKGDFEVSLEVYGCKIEQVNLAKALSIKFGTKVLISDDDINPFKMLLVHQSMPISKVFLDEDKLDDEIYKIKMST